jgi:hypothetical protein
MYCPNCAAPYSYGLRYCKQCGTNLADPPQPATEERSRVIGWRVGGRKAGDAAQTGPLEPPRKMTGAAWALAMATVAITLGGLGIVFTHAFDLMRWFPVPGEGRAGNPTPVAIVMLVFGSLTILGVTGMLMRLFTHLLAPRAHSSAPPARADHSMTAPPVQLPAPPSAIGSVTEHTTRNFEAAYRNSGEHQ